MVLTKSEEEIMLVLWDIKRGSVKKIIDQLSDPKPAYNTVSTVVRVLENKGYVDYQKKGKTHIYFPLLDKRDYTTNTMKKFTTGYFNGSFKTLISHFIKTNDIDLKDLEDIINDSKSQNITK